MSPTEYLLSPVAIRERTEKIWQLTLDGQGLFILDESKIEETASFVVEVIHDNYPDLKIPYHSRWGHFRAGSPRRLDGFFEQLPADRVERIRICVELAVTSVLLDAGAGSKWKFKEEQPDGIYTRSEGLAVASYHLFCSGAFSEKGESIADAVGLSRFSVDRLSEGFQVTVDNPLVGVEGRVSLINGLSKVAAIFDQGRLGGIVDQILENKNGSKISAVDIFNCIIRAFGPIWPGRIEIDGTNMGDVWTHSKLGPADKAMVPFHKLSQWLSYSLFEPFEWNGFEITDMEKLTGLAEYRNGGLFVDTGVLRLKDEKLYEQKHRPDSDLIIEWRGLTVQLLDRVAVIVQQKLGMSAVDFPLARVLEGGTWAAGRRLAKELRVDSSPPIQIESDGTVF